MKALKLNQLEKQHLSAREMQSIQGGQQIRVCNCSCYYAGTPGGSSIDANSSANFALGSGGGSSTTGEIQKTEIEIRL